MVYSTAQIAPDTTIARSSSEYYREIRPEVSTCP